MEISIFNISIQFISFSNGKDKCSLKTLRVSVDDITEL